MDDFSNMDLNNFIPDTSDKGSDPFSLDATSQLQQDFGGQAVAGPSMWDSITGGIQSGVQGLGSGLSSLFGSLTGNGAGYQFPTQAVLGGLLGMLGQNSVQGTLQNM